MNSRPETHVVLCTFPDLDTARSIAKVLLQERLIACVNLVPQVESLYEWEGQLETSQEVLAILKTTLEAYPSLEARLADLHPYEVPEILALPVEAGLAAYTQWVGQQVPPVIKR